MSANNKTRILNHPNPSANTVYDNNATRRLKRKKPEKLITID